jgi:hypothetical protein
MWERVAEAACAAAGGRSAEVRRRGPRRPAANPLQSAHVDGSVDARADEEARERAAAVVAGGVPADIEHAVAGAVVGVLALGTFFGGGVGVGRRGRRVIARAGSCWGCGRRGSGPGPLPPRHPKGSKGRAAPRAHRLHRAAADQLHHALPRQALLIGLEHLGLGGWGRGERGWGGGVGFRVWRRDERGFRCGRGSRQRLPTVCGPSPAQRPG